MPGFWQSKTKIRYTDRLFSSFIRRRDGDCVYKIRCHGHIPYEELTCSHYKGRGKESTRFDPLNCDSACRPCHAWIQDTAEGKKWLEQFKINQLGQPVHDLLILRYNTPQKRDDGLDLLYVKQLLKEL